MVVALLALDDVAAVAWIPGEGVVARAHQGDVVALAAVENVVLVTAEQQVVAQTAEELVVSGVSLERQGDRLCGEAGCRDGVVAAECVDDEGVARLCVANRDCSPQARNEGTGGILADADLVI